jgi:type II secretory pathway pseudopilin PulG
MRKNKATLVENLLALVLMGILAGALGGLAVGLITGHTSHTATTTQ